MSTSNKQATSSSGGGRMPPASPSFRSMRLHTDRHRGLANIFDTMSSMIGSRQSSGSSAGVIGTTATNNNPHHHRATTAPGLGASWPSFLAPPIPLQQNVYRQQEDAEPADQRQVSQASQHSAPLVMVGGGAGGISPSSSNRGLLFLSTSQNFSSHHGRDPFLTVVLLKLHQVLPVYLRRFTEPTKASASQACAILDSTVSTTMSSSSPAAASGSCSSPKQQSSSWSPYDDRNQQPPSSPLSLKYWMSSPSANQQQQQPHSPTSSALALEGEFESFVAPFLLLAGAEVLMANLQHLQPSSRRGKTNNNTTTAAAAAVGSLSGLYQHVGQDLVHTRDVLCEPFLRSSNDGGCGLEPDDSSHYAADAAHAVAAALEQLLLVTGVRGQLIDLQAAVFGGVVLLQPPPPGNNQDVGGDENTKSNGKGDPLVADDSNNGEPSSILGMAQAAAAVTILLQTVEVAAAATATMTVPDDMARQDEPANHETSTEVKQEKETAIPIVSNLLEELAAWKYCFESCAALEKCQFLETIVSLRQWQLHLPSKNLDTQLARWMHQSYDQIMSLLPVYFDRVQAFSRPFYGFDTAALWKRGDTTNRSSSSSSKRNLPPKKTRTDWSASVTDFLRRQEKLGGPPTAVALVLDATGASNLHAERGFRLAAANAPPTPTSTTAPVVVMPAAPPADDLISSSSSGESSPEAKLDSSHGDNALGVQWPPVYLRSTLHLATSSTTNSSSVRASPRSSGLLRGSQGSLLAGWSSTSNVSSSPKVPPGKSGGAVHHHQHHHPSIFEYAPDTGTAFSWPHSDWGSLARILEKKDLRLAPVDTATSGTAKHREGTVVTYRYDEEEKERESRESVNETVDEFASFFSIHSSETSTTKIPVTVKRQSTFYVVSISEWLSIVVMVKEEESRWHLRRNRLEDDEIREFLHNLAKNLCISRIMSYYSLRSLVLEKDKRNPMISLPYDDNLTWDDEKRVQDFLAELKEVFGLRPISPYMPDSFYRASPRTPVNPRASAFRRRRLLRQKGALTSMPESAAALFLGPELADLFA